MRCFRIKKNYQTLRILVLMLLSGVLAPGNATELVYAPVNPSFGGNPNNAPGLMGIAQAQNSFKSPLTTPVEAFNQSLQRAILSRLTSQTMTAMFGTSSVLMDGSYQTPGYTINVEQVGNGILITTTDKTTGAIASFEISTP